MTDNNPYTSYVNSTELVNLCHLCNMDRRLIDITEDSISCELGILIFTITIYI